MSHHPDVDDHQHSGYAAGAVLTALAVFAVLLPALIIMSRVARDNERQLVRVTNQVCEQALAHGVSRNALVEMCAGTPAWEEGR